MTGTIAQAAAYDLVIAGAGYAGLMAALVARVDGLPVVVIMIDTDGDLIHSVFAIANPDKIALQ